MPDQPDNLLITTSKKKRNRAHILAGLSLLSLIGGGIRLGAAFLWGGSQAPKPLTGGTTLASDPVSESDEALQKKISDKFPRELTEKADGLYKQIAQELTEHGIKREYTDDKILAAVSIIVYSRDDHDSHSEAEIQRDIADAVDWLVKAYSLIPGSSWDSLNHPDRWPSEWSVRERNIAWRIYLQAVTEVQDERLESLHDLAEWSEAVVSILKSNVFEPQIVPNEFSEEGSLRKFVADKAKKVRAYLRQRELIFRNHIEQAH